MTLTVVSSGVTSTGLNVASGDQLAVQSGGIASNTLVGSGGIVYVSGGTAFSTEVGSGAYVYVSSGGTTSGTMVGQDGSEDVLSGGSAFGTLVNSGGVQLLSGGAAYDTVASSGGTQYVNAGGTASDTIVAGGGVEYVNDNGTVSGTVVRSGGVQAISSGTATGTVLSGGIEYVDVGTASSTTVGSGAGELVYSGGNAFGGIVQAGGLLVVLPGGSAADVTGEVVSSDAVILVTPNGVTDLGNTVTDASAGSGDTLYVLSGGAASGTEITDANMIVFAGGVASGTLVNSLGTDYVASGGMTSGTIVSGGGAVEFVSGGTSYGTLVSSGGAEFVSAGTAFRTIVNSGGVENVYSGGVGFGTQVSNGGNVIVSGGTVFGTILSNGGTETLYNGGTATGTVVEADAIENVYYIGTTSGTVVSSGGEEFVAGGGVASGSIISSGGSEDVGGGGTATGLEIQAGSVHVESGGNMTGTVTFTGAGGLLTIDDSTDVTATIVGFAAGDTIDLTGLLYAGDRTGTLSDTTLLISEGTAAATLTFDPAGLTDDIFHFADDGVSGTFVTVTCFCAGTQIATFDGETPVEAIRAGDLVRLADGGVAAVRWVGVQTVSAKFCDAVRVLPIRLRAGSLGENLPKRDLLVSPAHGLLLEGTLVQAGALVGMAGIAREHAIASQFRYYHIELDAHALLLAEGVAAESYLPVNEDVAFDNRASRPARQMTLEMPHTRVKAARQLPRTLQTRLSLLRAV
jgi:autotransporter passenger strand-loop-strand repeat protein